MDKTEIIIGDMMIKRIDSLNWQLFERREIKKQNNPNFKSREGEIDWIPIQAFFGTLRPALIKAKEINRARKIMSGSLDDAIKVVQAADADFIKQVDKALAKLEGGAK